MLLQRTGPMPPYSTVAYIIMLFCHFCGMLVSFQVLLFQFAALQQTYKTARLAERQSPPLRCRRRPRPPGDVPRGAARLSSPPALDAASFKLALAAAASADACFAAAVPQRPRRQSQLRSASSWRRLRRLLRRTLAVVLAGGDRPISQNIVFPWCLLFPHKRSVSPRPALFFPT